MNTSFSDLAARKKKAEQGKSAEGDVREYLEAKANADATFDWQRGYDARAAGGKFQRVAGDFSVFAPGYHGILEVKEIAHEYRLPYGNFAASQIGKAYARKLAGGRVIVLVHSTANNNWVFSGIDFFRHSDKNKGSWDLRGLLQWGPDLKGILSLYFDGGLTL